MPDAFNLGTAIVGPTITPISSIPTPVRGVVLRADSKNTADVDVVRTGGDLSSPYVLHPGETVNLTPGDLQKVSLVASVAGQRIGWHTLKVG